MAILMGTRLHLRQRSHEECSSSVSNKFVTILCLEAVTFGPISLQKESKDPFVFQFCGAFFCPNWWPGHVNPIRPNEC
jgi:hypothetical protein